MGDARDGNAQHDDSHDIDDAQRGAVPVQGGEPVEAQARFNRARRDSRQGDRVLKSPRRVHAMLRSRIQAGDLAADEVLVEEDVMRSYATSRNAVREALAMLAADGLVLRSPRTGTTVVADVRSLTIEGFHAPLPDERWRTTTALLESATVPSTPFLRSALATADEHLTMDESLVSVDGEPFCVYTSYHVRDAGTLWLSFDDPSWTLAGAFERTFGVPLDLVETTLQATPCEPRTSRRLGLDPGMAVLVRSRLLTDVTGAHREFSYTYWVDRKVMLRSRTRLSAPGPVPHRTVSEGRSRNGRRPPMTAG